MRCEEIRAMIPAYVDEKGAQLSMRRHLSRCSGCRTELRRYEALAGALQALATTTAEPPARLLPSLVEVAERPTRLDEARFHVIRNRRRYLGGLGAAALVGATAVFLSRNRRVAVA